MTALRAIALLLALMLPGALPAGESWDGIRAQLYGTRPMLDGAGVIALDAPYRTGDDARTRIAARIAAPEGALISKVTLVLDENPMPVSAVFDLAQPQARFVFDATMRINGPTPVHLVAQATDGRLFVTEGHVKTSGQGACSAPPGTDPDKALATLGAITLGTLDLPTDRLAPPEHRLRSLDVAVSHPSHSGMQMDQISLLFIPMRYVRTLAIDTDGRGYATMTGSISLSENPRVTLSVPARTGRVAATMTDTSGTVTRAEARLAGY